MKFSQRIQAVEDSRTVRFTALIARLRREGREVIDFAVGEPHFETPPEIIAATRGALEAGETRYGPVGGLPELRERLSGLFEGYGPENILITNGSKQGLFTIFQTICDPGDEVILPSPCWVSFTEQIRLAGGTPVLVPTRDHQLDLDAIARAVTPNTIAILINSPNNPTGAVYPGRTLGEIVQLVRKHNLYLISDEAYRDFVYDDQPPVNLFDDPEIRDQLLVVRSFSKEYSMTGFRIGYVAASRPMIQALAKLQSHLTGNVCTFAQYGALAASVLDPEQIQARRKELARKRELAWGYASSLFPCVRPGGAFYLFPEVLKHCRKNETAEDFAGRLLDETGVAVVPGEAFGGPGHIRISYALPEDLLITGFERIADALGGKGGLV